MGRQGPTGHPLLRGVDSLKACGAKDTEANVRAATADAAAEGKKAERKADAAANAAEKTN